ALLAGVGWAETRWQMVQGAEEFPGRPAAFGVMALRGAALERGASLAGVTPEEARRDAVANIRAAAAVLDAYASEAGAARERIEQWSAVIARYGEIGIPAARAAYLGQVDRGVALAGARPGLAIGSAAQAACPSPDTAALDYPQAIWRPSPNFDQRPTDATGALHMVIIHTCESNYAGCWSWLVNSVSQASAHYVVDEDGAEVSQLVRERDRAWHIAALYDCTLNRRHDCWRNDVQSNDFTVGIEHAGLFNDAAVATVSVPATWTATDTTPDYYGGGYRWAPTQPAATDAAVFSFLVTAAGSRTLDARWTSGTNRSPRAEYAVITSAGVTLATVPVDQRTGGGSWHALGTWTLPAGWNRVALLRRDASGAVVVADAVRVRE
ncbi:MAG: hypothetical protein DMD56_13015, partial [Gemmatimonadetes bacterium]